MAAIGAVERRADEGPFRQLPHQRFQQDLLFFLLIGLVETAIEAGRLPAYHIQLGGHAVVGLAADHLLIVAHGDLYGDWQMRPHRPIGGEPFYPQTAARRVKLRPVPAFSARCP
ncbi:hypothetical protein D3C78_1594700 [compost metagenome]